MNYDKFIIRKKAKLCIVFFFFTFFTINYSMTQEADYGFVTKNEGDIYELEFRNKTGNVIYYRGPVEDIGEYGKYWICENNIKNIILEKYIEQRPIIIWHSDYLAEIVLLITREKMIGFHSYFFDFSDNTISKQYYFPIYIDKKNNYVITLDWEGLNVYNIKTNELIQVYSKSGLFDGVITFWYYYFNYSIEIENNKLVFSYRYSRYGDEIEKTIEFEYNY